VTPGSSSISTRSKPKRRASWILFGDASLICESGRIGRPGRKRIELYETQSMPWKLLRLGFSESADVATRSEMGRRIAATEIGDYSSPKHDCNRDLQQNWRQSALMLSRSPKVLQRESCGCFLGSMQRHDHSPGTGLDEADRTRLAAALAGAREAWICFSLVESALVAIRPAFRTAPD
jgi:hypothetical protein